MFRVLQGGTDEGFDLIEQSERRGYVGNFYPHPFEISVVRDHPRWLAFLERMDQRVALMRAPVEREGVYARRILGETG